MYYLSVSHKYHHKTNDLIETTDAFGLKTQYKYDNFNRLIETTDPLGIIAKKEYEWELNSNIENAVFSIKTFDSKNPFLFGKTFYDKKAREIRTEKREYANKYVYTDTKYDRLGNVANKTEPYYNGNQNPDEISYKYYPSGINFNKLQEITKNQLTTNYEYDVNSSTITPPSGLSYTKNFDVAGNLSSSTHPLGNTVNFTYGSHGQPLNINANGVITTSEYNNLGQQTKLIDVNAGTINYEYYKDGTLKKQTDARGNKTEVVYDEYDRIKQIKINTDEEIIAYDYYTTGNARTRLKSISNGDNTVLYEYDDLGRITKLTETIDTEDFSYQYEYNEKGNTFFLFKYISNYS